MRNASVLTALVAVGLGACLVAGCSGDDATADGGPDTSGHEVSIDGPCVPETFVGGFEVAARESGTYQYSVVGGAIADGVNWNTIPVLRDETEECRLVEFVPWSCSPGCGANQICNNEATCVPFPSNLDMGTVGVEGLTTAVEIEPNAAFDYQFNDDITTPDVVELENPPYTPNEPVLLWAVGNDQTGELFFDGMGVTPLTVENKAYTMYDNEDMTVTWNPSGDAAGEVYGQFMIDQHGASKMWIYCTWDDAAGQGVVPAAFTHELYLDLLEAPLLGWATAYLFRRTVDSVQLPQGCAELRVLSQIQLDLDYIPPGSDTDIDTDTDTDTDTDADTDSDADCTGLGGTCNEAIWELCGPGTEPYSVTDALDCGLGLCCVPAEGEYSCNESDLYEDCIPAATCTGCWDAAPSGYECEADRACCTYICD